MVRMLQVANNPAYANTTTPQTNDLALSIPWSRASPSVTGGMSAICYYLALEMLGSNPARPVGIVSSNWGGTSINVWMSPSSLEACRGQKGRVHDEYFSTPVLVQAIQQSKLGAGPSRDSSLYYSMIYPLLVIPFTTIFWYQGENNSNNPSSYAVCFPAMIQQWRDDFNAHTSNASGTALPFVFVQLAPWPNLDNGAVANTRYAQSLALRLPNTGMVVAADQGDPASAYHPVHPPFKAELSRRANLIIQNLVFANKSSPTQGPWVSNVTVDEWDPSWGDFHLGYGGGDSNQCIHFLCGGIRVQFDQPLTMMDTFGLVHGNPANGFEIWDATEQYFQAATLTGLWPGDASGRTLQLNFTWTFSGSWSVSGGQLVGFPPVILKHAWRDYPAILVYGPGNLPAAPFNVTLNVNSTGGL